MEPCPEIGGRKLENGDWELESRGGPVIEEAGPGAHGAISPARPVEPGAQYIRSGPEGAQGVFGSAAVFLSAVNLISS